MSIEKFTTRGLILDIYVSGENDAMLRVYTEDFGVISVVAKSLRKREGKLKAHVRKYHYANLTLIRGREVWRLGGATEILIASPILPEVAKGISRFVNVEQRNSLLFVKIYNILDKFNSEDFAQETLQRYRALYYCMLLIDLGYMDAQVLGVSNIEEYKSLDYQDILLYIGMHKDFINKSIRLAIRESML